MNLPSGITFAYNSSQVQTQFRQTLDQVAYILSQYKQTYIDVYGHTDSTGSHALNQQLGLKRAEAVRMYLSRAGLPLARMALADGMGVMAISPADKGGRLYDPPPPLLADCAPFQPLELAYRFLLDLRLSAITPDPLAQLLEEESEPAIG